MPKPWGALGRYLRRDTCQSSCIAGPSWRLSHPCTDAHTLILALPQIQHCWNVCIKAASPQYSAPPAAFATAPPLPSCQSRLQAAIQPSPTCFSHTSHRHSACGCGCCSATVKLCNSFDDTSTGWHLSLCHSRGGVIKTVAQLDSCAAAATPPTRSKVFKKSTLEWAAAGSSA